MISALRVQAIPGEEGRNIEPTTWTHDTAARRDRNLLVLLKDAFAKIGQDLEDLSAIRRRSKRITQCAPVITRQVASDLGTLGTSLGRAGRIRQLLGALGAVAVRMAACSTENPKRCRLDVVVKRQVQSLRWARGNVAEAS